MYGGGGYWGGGGRIGGGPGGMGRRLRSALDAADEDDILGKVYDVRVIRRMPKYLAWVKKYLVLAGTGTVMRTVANIAMPYLVAIATDQFHKNPEFEWPQYCRPGLYRLCFAHVGWPVP